MNIRKLSNALGAEVTGVDLKRIGDRDFDAIRDAWHEHLLLVFRDQQLDYPDYIRFGELDGNLLSNARIDNRIIVVSACYSGGFVAPLANPTTLVITAADQSRRSYGCGNDSEITDFARAFYTRALMQTRSLPKAARYAQQLIHGEERATQREHSYPQMQVGVLMEEKLQKLERRLSR